MSVPGPTDAQRHLPVSGLVALAVVMMVAAVVGVVAAGSRGPSTAPRPPAPEDLRARPHVCIPPACDRVGSGIALTWSTPDGDVEAIEVLVDGAVLARLGPTITWYEASDLWIGRSYSVGVRAVGPTGMSPTSALEVRMPVPGPEEAQLDGPYRVRQTVRSATNLSTLDGMHHPGPGSQTTSTWSFSSLCAQGAGACAANWFRWGPLRNDGTRYEGTFLSRPADCVGGPSTPTTTTMRLVVERGRPSAGHWIVGRFHGVMSVHFSCPGDSPSAAELRIEGRARP